MKKFYVISTVNFLLAATQVLTLPPPAGFVFYPIYNFTNNSHGQHYPLNGNHCSFLNIPEPGSHSIYTGCITYYDRLLYGQVHEKGPLWYKAREKIIRYPPIGGGNEIITGVRIKDLDTYGQGGFAHINGGGIGSKFVEIKLYSPRNRGFKFQVNIYGR